MGAQIEPLFDAARSTDTECTAQGLAWGKRGGVRVGSTDVGTIRRNWAAFARKHRRYSA